MKREILRLRELMLREGMDVYYVPSGDYHSSEYVNDYFKCREFLSNLTGEAGELIVVAGASEAEAGAYLWTDGRYFLQAETQLAGTGIELMRMAEPGVPTIEEFLAELADKMGGYVLGFDGRVLPGATGLALEKELTAKGVSFKYEKDLVDEVWEDRPAIEPSKVYELPIASAGRTAEEKLANVRAKMEEKCADFVFVSDLMETAWLFNLRGADIDYTPVFFSYTLIGKDCVRLYVMDGAVTDEIAETLSFATLRPYDSIAEDLAAIGADKKLWLNSGSANYTLVKTCMEAADGENIVDELTPIAMMKVCKNEAEIASTRYAHIKDGAAMVKFIKWVKDKAGKEPMTELSAAAYLEDCRREQEGCFDLSFETISGYGPNGAIIHYAPTQESDAEIKAEGFLLVDSGGQYLDGTTDITRTLALGELTDEMKENYTYVLKSHIKMMLMDVPKDMNGVEFDTAVREPMRAVGKDFKHGVSHGVGHVLGVHEGPNVLRRVPTPIEFLPGMIMSDEPGYYVDGEYGIRIENEVLFVDKGNGDMTIENLTFCPYERKAIKLELLDDAELNFLNKYNLELREKLNPLLDDECKAWLEEETKGFER